MEKSAETRTLNVPAVPEFTIREESFRQKAAAVFPGLNFTDDSPIVTAKTEIRLITDRKNLYIGVFCDEPLRIDPAGAQENPWQGDCIEVFLARRDRPSWYRHLIVGANGCRASLMVHESQWSAETARQENSWNAVLTVPFSALGPLDGDLGFNVVRTRKAAGELITWQPVGKKVLSPEKYGAVIFEGSPSGLFHAPWTFRTGSDSTGIAWETFLPGQGAAFIREKTDGSWRKLTDSRTDTMHSVQADGLRENTVYEYWVPGNPEFGEFRTLSPQSADFSFILTADVHCRARQLADLLKQPMAENADLLFLLGDQIDASLARENHYDGFLDVLLEVWKQPFYCLYGNHESRGPMPDSFYDVFCGGKRHGYGTLVHKGVCFVLLDTDHDGRIASDYLNEQIAFLRQTVKSAAFRQAQWWILLLHVPLTFRSDPRWGEDNFAILTALTEEERNFFDLAFSGHTHICCRTLPGDTAVWSTGARHSGLPVRPFPVPEFTGPQLGLTRVEKTAGSLTIDVFDPEGKPLDHQVIRRKDRN